jgi:hypothetical protein
MRSFLFVVRHSDRSIIALTWPVLMWSQEGQVPDLPPFVAGRFLKSFLQPICIGHRVIKRGFNTVFDESFLIAGWGH